MLNSSERPVLVLPFHVVNTKHAKEGDVDWDITSSSDDLVVDDY